MTHCSGYRDYYPLDFLDRRMQKPIMPDTLIRQYCGEKLDFEPGTRWSYSNTGFNLAAIIVSTSLSAEWAVLIHQFDDGHGIVESISQQCQTAACYPRLNSGLCSVTFSGASPAHRVVPKEHRRGSARASVAASDSARDMPPSGAVVDRSGCSTRIRRPLMRLV